MVKKAATLLVAATRSQPTRTHHQGRPRGRLLIIGKLKCRVGVIRVAPARLKFKSYFTPTRCITVAKLLDLSNPVSHTHHKGLFCMLSGILYPPLYLVPTSKGTFNDLVVVVCLFVFSEA